MNSVTENPDGSKDASKEAAMASDMAITSHDLNVASQGRIGLVIVPFADKNLIDQADKLGLAMITTGNTNVLF